MKKSVTTIKQPPQGKYRVSKLHSKTSMPPQVPLLDLEAHKSVEVFEPDNLSITAEFIDEVLFWGPACHHEEYKAFVRVQTALTTAKTMKANLERGKNELEAIKEAIATMSPGMTSKGILFWDGVDDDSKDLLPETYALVRKLEMTLAQETERLNRALNIKIIVESLRSKSCVYSGLSTGPASITALVQETGLSFETITTIVNDLKEVMHKGEVVDGQITPEVRRRFAELMNN